MDIATFQAAGDALLIMTDPYRLLLLSLGVVMGLVLGVLPGVGTTAGVAMILPFTFGIDPYAGFAILIGLAAVGATGDPIPAIMFGVPGGAGSAATVLDGQPMARRGEAGRALSAAYMASLLGGLCGAVLLFISIPILRAFILSIGAPQLLAFSAFGISMVAVLSGTAPLRGLAAACLGLMLSLVGSNPQTGTLRWTFDTLYLWEGVPLVSIVLGLFALPELADLAIRRTSVAPAARYDVKSGMVRGALDCFQNWWLVVRCSTIGAAIGTIPGVTGAVVDWIMYGHALSTEKGARQTFGRGDVRGVIAVESSNNSKEAGQLVPAIAFGVPTTASMALIIGAFFSYGLVPGPDMLTKHLDVTFAMVWSMAIANVVGAGLCYAASGYLAKLSLLRYTLILPGIICIIMIGAFQTNRHWGDLYVLLIFGLVGWAMKQLKWPRPPLILGVVLGEMVERYLFISTQRYGWAWATKPVVIILFVIALYTLFNPLIRAIRFHGGLGALARKIGRPSVRASDLFHVALILVFVYMLVEALSWDSRSQVVPVPLATLGLLFTTLSLASGIFFRPVANLIVAGANAPKHETDAGGPAESAAPAEASEPQQQESYSIHMDLDSDTGHLGRTTVLARGALFFGWIVGFMVSMYLIGFIPTVPLFIVAYMRTEAREAWKLILPQAIVITFLVYYVFGKMLYIPWPDTLLGTLFPALTVIPSV
jgi:TctA family transporter